MRLAWLIPVLAATTWESNRLFAQVRLSYELSPQTVVYAGYSGTTTDFDGLELSPQERSVFLKLGYRFALLRYSRAAAVLVPLGRPPRRYLDRRPRVGWPSSAKRAASRRP